MLILIAIPEVLYFNINSTQSWAHDSNDLEVSGDSKIEDRGPTLFFRIWPTNNM